MSRLRSLAESSTFAWSSIEPEDFLAHACSIGNVLSLSQLSKAVAAFAAARGIFTSDGRDLKQQEAAWYASYYSMQPVWVPRLELVEALQKYLLEAGEPASKTSAFESFRGLTDDVIELGQIDEPALAEFLSVGIRDTGLAVLPAARVTMRCDAFGDAGRTEAEVVRLFQEALDMSREASLADAVVALSYKVAPIYTEAGKLSYKSLSEITLKELRAQKINVPIETIDEVLRKLPLPDSAQGFSSFKKARIGLAAEIMRVAFPVDFGALSEPELRERISRQIAKEAVIDPLSDDWEAHPGDPRHDRWKLVRKGLGY